MKRGLLILALMVPVAILVAIAGRALRSNEPRYYGKLLSVWLREYQEQRNEEAINAVRNIGTNALPTLLRLASAKDPSARRDMLKFASQYGEFSFEGASDAQKLAMCGYGILGPLASGAVASLTNLLNDPDLQMSAIGCLGHLGPTARDAVPALIAQLSNTNYLVAACAKVVLGNITHPPEQAVSALAANLATQDKTPHLTIQALGRLGEAARPAIPAILPFLADSRAMVRTQATNALKAIDAEAAARAGVK